jgi:hypothetical protein
MITLTPENSRSITKLAALIGWTSDQLANHLTVGWNQAPAFLESLPV